MKRSMQFHHRNIRSAGRGSGSVEITLPVDLAVLEGVKCGLELRDGLMPVVVLRPDLGFLVTIFEALWQRLALGLEPIGDIGGFSEGDYVLGLFAERGLADRPCLAYADALLARQCPRPKGASGVDLPERALEAYARMIEAMATVAGQRLGLSLTMASLLGNQIAYTATGAPVASVDAFARGALADVSGDVGWCEGEPLGENRWLAARPTLERLYMRLADWSDDGSGLQEARDHWYRARRVETRVQTLGT
ncbi:MAG: hypothetical protein HQ482_01230 [Sphingomonadales bacterium]|nr:hypothetical protein [Sphingomonadales bacterium]